MIALFSLIADTLWEFWQYLKPHGNVYLAGVKHPTKDGYLFITMIPEKVDVPQGYERLTYAMPVAKASQRWNHFKLIELVVPENSPETGT
jgi:hypothetical protein